MRSHLIVAAIALTIQAAGVASTSRLGPGGGATGPAASGPAASQPTSAPAPADTVLRLAVSKDGLSFADRSSFFPEPASAPALALLPNGHLLAMCDRVEKRGAPSTLVVAKSEDDGRHWTTPRPLQLAGLDARLLRARRSLPAWMPDRRLRLFFLAGNADKRKPGRASTRPFDGVVLLSAVTRDGLHYQLDRSMGLLLGTDADVYATVLAAADEIHLFIDSAGRATGAKATRPRAVEHLVSPDGRKFHKLGTAFVPGLPFVGSIVPVGKRFRAYVSATDGIRSMVSDDAVHWAEERGVRLAKGSEPAVVQLKDETYLMLYCAKADIRSRGLPPLASGPAPGLGQAGIQPEPPAGARSDDLVAWAPFAPEPAETTQVAGPEGTTTAVAADSNEGGKPSERTSESPAQDSNPQQQASADQAGAQAKTPGDVSTEEAAASTQVAQASTDAAPALTDGAESAPGPDGARPARRSSKSEAGSAGDGRNSQVVSGAGGQAGQDGADVTTGNAGVAGQNPQPGPTSGSAPAQVAGTQPGMQGNVSAADAPGSNQVAPGSADTARMSGGGTAKATDGRRPADSGTVGGVTRQGPQPRQVGDLRPGQPAGTPLDLEGHVPTTEPVAREASTRAPANTMATPGGLASNAAGGQSSANDGGSAGTDADKRVAVAVAGAGPAGGQTNRASGRNSKGGSGGSADAGAKAQESERTSDLSSGQPAKGTGNGASGQGPGSSSASGGASAGADKPVAAIVTGAGGAAGHAGGTGGQAGASRSKNTGGTDSSGANTAPGGSVAGQAPPPAPMSDLSSGQPAGGAENAATAQASGNSGVSGVAGAGTGQPVAAAIAGPAGVPGTGGRSGSAGGAGNAGNAGGGGDPAGGTGGTSGQAPLRDGADGSGSQQAGGGGQGSDESPGRKPSDTYPPLPDFQNPVDYIEWLRQQYTGDVENNALDAYDAFMPNQRQVFEPGQRHPAEPKKPGWPEKTVDMFNGEYNGPIIPWDPAQYPEWEATHQSIQGLLDQFREATRVEQYACPIIGPGPEAYPDGQPTAIDVVLPNLATHRRMTKATMADAWRETNGQVDPGRMVEAFETSLRNAGHMQQGFTLIHHLVGLAEQGLVEENARKALQHNVFTAPQEIESALNTLRQYDHYDGGAASWLPLEHGAALDMVQYLFTPAGSGGEPRFNRQRFDSLVSEFPDPLPERAKLDRIAAMSPEEIRQSAADVDAYYRELRNKWQTGYPQVRKKDLELVEGSHSKYSPLTELVIPSLARAYEMTGRNEASRRATQLAYEVHLFKARYGRWPTSLNELPASPGDKSRTDPFTGGDFGYQMTETGPKIYSTGDDGQDNGGVHSDKWDAGKDYVFWPPQK